MRKRHHHRRAFLLTDAVFSLSVALLLVMILSVTIFHQRAAEKKLAAIRTLSRQTESLMLNVQQGAPLPPNARFESLDAPAPANHHWARLTLRPEPEDPAAKLVPEGIPIVALLPNREAKP